jgi:replicative DNA helicase
MNQIDRLIQNIDKPEELDEVFRAVDAKRSYLDFKVKQLDDSAVVPISDYTEAAKARLAAWGKLQGLSTGYKELDAMTGGLCGGELIILAGQTSHGKSQLAANIAYNIAVEGDPVLFVTLEMTKPETTSRFMKIYEYENEFESPEGVAGLPILFQTKNELDYRDIGLLMQRAKVEGAKAVIIDHLHYFPRGTGDNVRNEIGRITKHFKECAIEHDLPVILLSHTRRLTDPKSKPSLSDLKESSAIEQDADIVLMVWRDLSEDSFSTNLVDVSILKNRNRGFPGFRVTGFQSPKDNGVRLVPLNDDKGEQLEIPDFGD